MAEAKGSSGHGGEGWVGKIVKDAAKGPPPLIILSGFIGPAAEKDATRLYLSADLSAWAEFPAISVLHQIDVPKEQNPLGGSTLWIEATAAIKYGGASTTGAGVAAAAAPAMAAAFTKIPHAICTAQACTLGVPCKTDACTIGQPCATHQALCATRDCTIACPSLAGCPTQKEDCTVLCTQVHPCHQHTVGPPFCKLTDVCAPGGIGGGIGGGQLGATFPIVACHPTPFICPVTHNLFHCPVQTHQLACHLKTPIVPCIPQTLVDSSACVPCLTPTPTPTPTPTTPVFGGGGGGLQSAGCGPAAFLEGKMFNPQAAAAAAGGAVANAAAIQPGITFPAIQCQHPTFATLCCPRPSVVVQHCTIVCPVLTHNIFCHLRTPIVPCIPHTLVDSSACVPCLTPTPTPTPTPTTPVFGGGGFGGGGGGFGGGGFFG